IGPSCSFIVDLLRYLEDIIAMKSAKTIWPEPELSAAAIMSSTSSSVSVSPIVVRIARRSAASMKPLPSLSNTPKAARSSSWTLLLSLVVCTTARKPSKSIMPLAEVSTILTRSSISASVGLKPSWRITLPMSALLMRPSPSVSKVVKATLNSATSAVGETKGMATARDG
ncbi:hypothetical protein PMAYCL1PPCAC_04604, partial [Pristionchus mayeri]